MRDFYTHTFFPTKVYSFFIDVNKDSIINYLYSLKENNKGVLKSNVGGWQSSNDLHLKKELQELCIALKLSSKKHLNFNIDIKEMWGNISSYGDYNKIHSHGSYNDTEWSGCFYLKTFSDSGDFVVHNRTHPSEHAPLNVKDNEVLFFQSDTYHSVLSNLESQDRVSIAFNFIKL